MAENNKSVEKESALERFGLWLAAWSEKWFPDAWVFALVGMVVVFIIGLLIGESPQKLAIEGGKAFWVLIPFTMQMALIIIGGYVVASTPAVYWVIRKVAGITTNPRTAIAWIAFFSMITSLISWGLSLIFSGSPGSRDERGRSKAWTSVPPVPLPTWAWVPSGPWGCPRRRPS